MKVEIQMHGLKDVMQALKSLPPEVVSKNGGPVRAALRRGAAIIRKQAQINLQTSIAAPGLTGITDSSGLTAQQVIIRRRPPPRGQKGERFTVSVRYKPHAVSKGQYRGRTIHYNDIAFILEAGTSTIPAQPWLQPAFNAKAPEALATIERELPRAILRIAKKHGLKVEGL